MVWVNDHSFSMAPASAPGAASRTPAWPLAPKFGFYECVNIKMNAWEPGSRTSVEPLRPDLGEAVGPRQKLLYGKARDANQGAARSAGPLLKVGSRTLRSGCSMT